MGEGHSDSGFGPHSARDFVPEFPVSHSHHEDGAPGPLGTLRAERPALP